MKRSYCILNIPVYAVVSTSPDTDMFRCLFIELTMVVGFFLVCLFFASVNPNRKLQLSLMFCAQPESFGCRLKSSAHVLTSAVKTAAVFGLLVRFAVSWFTQLWENCCIPTASHDLHQQSQSQDY